MQRESIPPDTSKEKYQSDGGIHIRHRTDKFLMIFDFRPVKEAVDGSPVMWLLRQKEHDHDHEESASVANSATALKEQIRAEYVDGVLTSPVLQHLRDGDRIHVDWRWTTEGSGG